MKCNRYCDIAMGLIVEGQVNTDIWGDDKLGRRDEAECLMQFLRSQLTRRENKGATASYVLNLDAPWGDGKTFFLSKLRSTLVVEGHTVALVNAWETDFSEQPLLAIMSAIDDALRPHLKSGSAIRGAWDAAIKSGGALAVSLVKNVASKAASRYAGDFVDNVSDAMGLDDGDSVEPPAPKSEDPTGIEAGVKEGVEKLADSALAKLIAAFRKEDKSIKIFKAQMSKVASEIRRSSPEKYIYVFVDELDRCRPSYAIKLLEAAKHLFSIDGVVFIIATDTDQLSESVKAVYGQSFDSKRYLYRFFDRTYRFCVPDRTSYLEYLFEKYDIDKGVSCPPSLNRASLSRGIFDSYDLSLRDIDQCFEILFTVNALWSKGVPLQLCYLLPLIVAHQQRATAEFNFLAGRGASPESRLMKYPRVIVSERVADRTHGSVKLIQSNSLEVLNEFADCLKLPLHQIDTNGVRSPGRTWVRRELQQEHQMLHGGVIYHDKPVYSVIREYAGLVELAVRFESEKSLAGAD